MKQRSITTILLLLAMSIGITSAQNSDVILQVAVSGFAEDIMQTAIDDYVAQNPNIQVQLVRTNGYGMNINTNSDAETLQDEYADYFQTADVLLVDSDLNNEATRAGYVLDLTPLTQSDPNFNQATYHQTMVDAFKWDFGQWALPISSNFVTLIYDTAAFDAVGLIEHAHKKPAQLSGGQQQRVAIAVALANQPRLLLADEPTGALDSDSAKAVMDLLMTLRQRYGLTVLMVTHDMKMANYADRVLTLRDGALGQELSAQESPKLDDEGRIQLPENVRGTLQQAPRVAVEIRPEGVLLRPEQDDADNTDALLADMLPQDAAPTSKSILSRMRSFFRKREEQTT